MKSSGQACAGNAQTWLNCNGIPAFWRPLAWVEGMAKGRNFAITDHMKMKERFMEDFLKAGVISSTHGVRGEVKVFPTTGEPQRFRNLKKVYLDTGKERIRLEIAGVKFFKQFAILKFRGIDNINDIEALSDSTVLAADAVSYILNYNLSANGYLWICSTRPVKSIIWGAMGLIADYEYQTAVISSNNNQEVYYCYRITDMLTAGQFVFLVNF